jgi:hypothetical protein
MPNLADINSTATPSVHIYARMQCPFGFKYGDDGRLQPDDREQVVVREARWYRGQRLTLQEVADQLNRRGHRNRAGGPFNATQIHRMIRRSSRPTVA